MKVVLQPSGLVLDVEPGERILEAASRQGLQCPHSCRNGSCTLCLALLMSGRVRQAGASCGEGKVYVCLAEPEQDCVLYWEGVLPAAQLPVRELSCQLIDCLDVGGGVVRVRLRAPAGKPPRYHAGQYLLLQRPSGEMAAFSLASAPHSERELELHIRARDEANLAMLEHLDSQKLARVQLPFGDSCLIKSPDSPLLLIAEGTGMAQMHALIEHCRALGSRQPIHLYWGVRRREDFYALPQWPAWEQEAHISLHRVVSNEPWSGRQGLLHRAICSDFSDFSGLQVYASGSPTMVYATLDALVAAGLNARQMHSDVFAYAPRNG